MGIDVRIGVPKDGGTLSGYIGIFLVSGFHM